MLIRMFCREGGFHSSENFVSKSKLPLDDELTIYSWKDATLKELTSLIKEVHPEARSFELKFLFRFYHQDSINLGRKDIHFKDFGIVMNSGKKVFTKFYRISKELENIPDEDRNLYDASFIQGDYIDVAIVNSRDQISFNIPSSLPSHRYYSTSQAHHESKGLSGYSSKKYSSIPSQHFSSSSMSTSMDQLKDSEKLYNGKKRSSYS